MDTTKKEVIFQIDFQDFFHNDTVTLRINDCLVFKDHQLTSEISTGLTDARVKGYLDDEMQISIFFSSESHLCMYSKDKISISIVLNHYIKKYVVDLSKGRYIGFSKKDKNELSFSQSQKPFIYD